MDEKTKTTYRYSEVYESTKEYFNGDELATQVWINKYCLKDSDGNLYEKNPSDMHHRLAKELYRIEQKYPNPLSEETIFNALDRFKYIVPAGGSLTGIGNPYQISSLSNCFVVGTSTGNSDSYGGILHADEELIQLMKRRGGVGHDLTYIRPTGSPVKNAALTSTGVVPFMERFSNSTREVAQDGRRGALMLSIDIKHPDSEKFIDAKMTEGKVTGANISVKIDDEFMHCVEENKMYELRYPVNSDNPKFVKEVNARELWKKIVHNAWRSAEPGILFWDNITKEAIPDCYGDEWKTISTNPCVSGDSLIYTTNGLMKMTDIVKNFKEGKNIQVLTLNTNTNEIETENITNALKTRENANIIELELEDGTKIKLTPDHKVYTENRGYIKASELTPNDILISINKTIKKIKIKRINIIQNEDVYDITTEKNHNFFCNNILVHNCGEVPLCDADSCRLIANNLYSFVENPFTDHSTFNLYKFEEMCKLSLRLMDDIVDLEIEKIQAIIDKIQSDPEPDEIKSTELNLWKRIQDKCNRGRRVGVGITGEGDMLAALGLTYGTEEATAFVGNIHRYMCAYVYDSSVILAKERGKFDEYDYEKEKDNPFIQRLPERLKKRMQKYGRRNIACLSIAPTGSLSILTQTTSGLEPVFKPVYKRRRKINPSDKNARIDFVDDKGDAFEEYIVYHPKFKTWMDINGYDINKNYTQQEIDNLVKISPYNNATANDINWIEKVRMQGLVQKYVDHSISITHNLPNDVTEDVVEKLYFEAWKSGCKGVTVYRDGSRNGVLISTDEKKKESDDKIIENRPKKLDCDVIRFTNKGEKWVAFVGLLNGEPYEIFTGVLDEDEGIFLPKNIDSGEIIKVIEEDGSKHYDFHYQNKNGYKMIIEAIGHKFNKEYWNYARLISGILRYKMPIENLLKLIDSLDVDNDTINTWKNGVKRALKRYIKNGTKSATKCPNCGGELIYQEGCLLCTNCGYSKCG